MHVTNFDNEETEIAQVSFKYFHLFQRWRWVTDNSRTPLNHCKITVTFYNVFFSTLAWSVWNFRTSTVKFSVYLKSLQSSQVHHVIAQLWHLGHQVYCFLLQRKPTESCITSCFNKLYKHLKFIRNIGTFLSWDIILSLWLTILLLFKTLPSASFLPLYPDNPTLPLRCTSGSP